MNKVLTAIGLMSGTSGDGIDSSIIQSDGEDELRIIGNQYIPYDNILKVEIRTLKEKINSFNDLKKKEQFIKELEKKITNLHAISIQKIINKFKLEKSLIDVVGFHGQTIYHSYKEKVSRQLADGFLLNKLTDLNIVYKFRDNDIKNGGQGAPLTPIYHNLIQNKFKLEFPSAFINIGGISNITYIKSKNKFLSFDTGPGNFLIDSFIQSKSNNKIQFDKNGESAFKGSINEIILENFLNNSYYETKPPKTLDVNDFNLAGIRGLTLEDSITTLSELTSRTICDSLNFFEEKPIQIFLSGGGRKNKYIFERINKLSKLSIKNIDDLNIDGDFIESQAFAYLAIKSFKQKPISFPESTGVNSPSRGGVLISSK